MIYHVNDIPKHLRQFFRPAPQLGLERTWIRHVARIRSVFRLARELLSKDGVLWLNYGDSYYSPRPPGGLWHESSTMDGTALGQKEFRKAARNKKSRVQSPDIDGPNRRAQKQFKPKDLMGMPWRVAFALQADGWYLRQDVIWSKPNPMPESIRDRCTKAHEYMFLFAKSERYYWDFEAMQEEVSGTSNPRRAAQKTPDGWDTGSGVGGHGSFHRAGREKGHLPGNKTHRGAKAYGDGDERHRTKGGLVTHSRKLADTASGIKNNESMDAALADMRLTRNKRSVWTIPSAPFKEAHFATFPRALIEPCILAGSRPGDIVFDPFMGSGTVAEVALSLGRRYIGTELNPAYAAMFKTHRSQQQGMPI